MPPTTLAILLVGLLLLISVAAARLSEGLKVPALLLFLGLGMLVGSEGPGGVAFDSPVLAQAIGTVALVLILFSGGLDTEWSTVRPVLTPGLVLSTVGVLITTLIVGTTAWWLLASFTEFSLGQDGLSWPEGLLLGAIVASTDAAAIFTLFRGGGPLPRPRIRALIELESGTNDPMAVILTTTLLGLITFQTAGPGAALFGLATGLLLGVGVGWAVGVVGALAIDRVRLGASGLYPVLALAFGLSAYGLAELVTGNGFLAVYVCGLLIGNRVTAGRTVIIQSNDALAWLAQIAMFLTMGLLIFPSDLIDVAPVGIAVAVVLMFVGRPASAFLCLAPWLRPQRDGVCLVGGPQGRRAYCAGDLPGHRGCCRSKRPL
ncbi:potassium/proton antiporter [Ornithinimicrobium sp. INDO-MA30-4]|nr:potassium/proton antiporter [Ornithinimicrobium sp. INDO-MA30-4]UJH70439.1 potassium/proton antiporter [Ornithinimicrobium sp. INDO-MA30-4]